MSWTSQIQRTVSAARSTRRRQSASRLPADFDAAPGEYHGWYSLSGESTAWRYADKFVDGVLLPCEGGDCGSAPEPESAVQTDSWGRIKASLR